LLHREAWPSKTNEQRDSELKTRFEDGLSNTEIAQYLRLHACDYDFAATVLKAHQFADAAESTRPKKTVRILKKPSQTVETADDEDAIYFQPLIESIMDVTREYFAPAVSNVNQVAQEEPDSRLHMDPGHSHLPAPPDHRPAAGCLTAQRPDNRQSHPMDRGNPRFNRPQANGRYNSPARPFQSPGRR